MNIVQNLIENELSEEDYTNVYGGMTDTASLSGQYAFILPTKPTDPLKPDPSLNQQPPHTGIFGG